MTVLLVGTAACGIGGGTANPCNDPVDDEPTTFAVGSGDPSDPDVIRGCIDDGADTDTFDLDDQDIGTGTITVRCFAAAGVAEFDTPTSSDFVACDPGGSSGFAHQADSAVDVAVRAPAGGGGGEYRLELLVA